LADIHIEQRIILKWILKKKFCADGDWIHLAHNRDKLLAPVDMVFKFLTS
jgi:hypothetical protein